MLSRLGAAPVSTAAIGGKLPGSVVTHDDELAVVAALIGGRLVTGTIEALVCEGACGQGGQENGSDAEELHRGYA